MNARQHFSLPTPPNTNTGHSIDNSALSYHHQDKRKIALPTLKGIHFERIDAIVSVEAKGNYALLHFKGNRSLLVSKTLCDIETLLNDHRFVRIHRSTTINLDYIEKYIKGKGGFVVLENGVSLPVSAGKRDHFLESLSIYFR